MKYDGAKLKLEARETSTCPFCKMPGVFYQYQQSKKYFWKHCLKCNFDARFKRLSQKELENLRDAEKDASDKNIQPNLFNHGNMQ